MVKFATLNPDGSLTNEREISQSQIMQCEHFILVPEHYREDGSCRCNDPDHVEMADWGYTWDGERWTAK